MVARGYGEEWVTGEVGGGGVGLEKKGKYEETGVEGITMKQRRVEKEGGSEVGRDLRGLLGRRLV